MTKVISWNVNGIRAAAKKGLLDWLSVEQPDILCIQESKAQPEQVTKEILSPEGYTSIWNSAEKKGYSGVVSYVKKEPISTTNLGVSEFDSEGRVQILEYKKFSVINAYFPNSQPERKRLTYKLDFVEAMIDYCKNLTKEGKNFVLCGDYNIAHKPIDLARPKPNENNPGYYIEEREAMDRFIDAGMVDTFRHFNKEPDNYTWWSYRAKARERNVGWRIDYHCVNEKFMKSIKESYILPDIMGSDHCPLAIKIK